MNRINATQIARKPGASIDQVLREGVLAITRRGRVVAVLSRDPVPMPPTLPVGALSMNALWENLSATLDTTEQDAGAFEITRSGRTVAWLLPRKMFQELES